MKKFNLLFLILLWTFPLYAAPSITGVSGAYTHGQTITVSGSSFGATGPTILSWDDFAGHTNNEELDGTAAIIGGNWSLLLGDNSPTVKYSTAYNRGGAKGVSAHVAWSGGDGIAAFGWAGKSPFTSVYISYWRYAEGPTDLSACNYKQYYLYGNSSQFPQSMLMIPGAESQWSYYNNCSDSSEYDNYTGWSWANTKDQWQRWETWAVLNTPGVANGVLQIWLDGVLTSHPRTNYKLRCDGNSGSWVDFRLGHMSCSTGGCPTSPCTTQSNAYYDDLYIATSRQRVEVGNASTYTACTHKEIQRFLTWADGSITFTINRGSFGASDTAYVYVVDASGVANANGSAITFGGSSGGTTYYVTQSDAGTHDGLSYSNSMSVSRHNSTTFAQDDIMYLCDTITSEIHVPRSGTSGHNIVYRGDYTGHAGIIDGSDLIEKGMHINGDKYITIRNLEIKNCTHFGIQLYAGDYDHDLYVTVQDCILHDISDDDAVGNDPQGRGIWSQGKGLTVSGCTIYNTWMSGIYSDGLDCIFQDNNIYNVSQNTHDDVQSDCLFVAHPTNCHIYNNTLNHGSNCSKQCVMVDDATNVCTNIIVENNTMVQGSNLILAGSYGSCIQSESSDIIIRGNLLSAGHNDAYGIYVPVANQKVYNNYVTVGKGITVIAGAGTGVKVYNNTLVGNANWGIKLTANDATVEAINNIISGALVGINKSANSIEDYNTVYNCGTARTGSNFGAHPVDSNPLLTGYVLSATSPCINTGTTLAAVTTDIRGVTRPQGGIYDIGAYEFVGATMQGCVLSGGVLH